jgi:hypothetical protein
MTITTSANVKKARSCISTANFVARHAHFIFVELLCGEFQFVCLFGSLSDRKSHLSDTDLDLLAALG